jgi:hypothetical protein
LPSSTGSIFVVFAVTNQTRRLVTAYASSPATRSTGSVMGAPVALFRTPAEFFSGAVVRHLRVGESAFVATLVNRSDRSIQVTVEGGRMPDERTEWTRFWGRLPWNQHGFSISATNELR